MPARKKGKNRPSSVPHKYFEYIDYVGSNVLDIPAKPLAYYLKNLEHLDNIAGQLPVAVYLSDYRTGQYLYLSPNCEQMLGHTHLEIKEKGQRWYIANNVHPDDLAVFSSEVFNRFLEHTRSFPKRELQNIRFSLNLRVRRKDGVYIHILQQSTVLQTDENGYPVVTMGTWIDVSAHKLDPKVVLAVSRYDSKTGFSVITSESFPNQKLQISGREGEIVKCLMEGKSSKQIADILHISVHTVNAHRRNILARTNCKNTAELINYAYENGIF